MPADFGRIVNKTQYQDLWIMSGPRSPQDWQAIKTGTGGTFMSFRIIGDKFAVWPMPTSALSGGVEYVSKYWAVSVASVAKVKFTADDDTSLFPENLLILGTKLKFFEVKGFDTTTLLSDFARELSKYKGSEAGAKTLNMARQVVYPTPSVPDTGFGA